MTDAALIEHSLVDGASFAGVFDRHFPAVHRFLPGRVGAQLADDLASETFAIAFGRRATYDRSRSDACCASTGAARSDDCERTPARRAMPYRPNVKARSIRSWPPRCVRA